MSLFSLLLSTLITSMTFFSQAAEPATPEGTNAPAQGPELSSVKCLDELNQPSLDKEAIGECLLFMKELSQSENDSFITKLINKIEDKKSNSSGHTKKLLDWVDVFMERRSDQATTALILSPQQKNNAEFMDQVFYILQRNNKSHLYLKLFEKHQATIISKPRDHHLIIDHYCLAAQFQSQQQKCHRLLAMLGKHKQDFWHIIVTASTLLSEGKDQAALQTLKKKYPQVQSCQSRPKVPWLNFTMAQIYRLQGDLSKSIQCLESFKRDLTYKDSEFYYYLELAKTQRLTDLKQANRTLYKLKKTFKEAIKYDYFRRLLLNIEILKNLLLKNKNQLLLKKINSTRRLFKPAELSHFNDLLIIIENLSKDPSRSDQSFKRFKDNFDTLDLKKTLLRFKKSAQNSKQQKLIAFTPKVASSH